jgi:hypothetical protein
MKKTLLIIVGVIVLILAAVGLSKQLGTSNNIIKAFSVEEGTFLASAQNASKIDVMAIPEGKTARKDSVKVGTMELVEKNDAGDQTWILEIPKEKQSYVEVYAQAFDAKNKKAGTIPLAQKTKEDITAVLWPAPKQVIIYGLVRELSGNTMRITNGSAREFDIVVTLVNDIKLLDKVGKPITRSRLTKNTMLVLTGTFTDEQAFTATQIELR